MLMTATLTELGSVADVFNGKTPSKKEQRRRGFPVLKIKEVDQFGRFRGTFDSFVDTDLVNCFPDKVIRENDTLLLNAAHNADYVASKSFFAIGSAVGALATGEWTIIRANPDQLDPRFLSFWLQTLSTKARIRDIVRGIHVYPTDLAELAILLPPLPEQQRVADQLEKADRLRRMHRYVLQLCDELIPAAFIEMFGEPVRNTRGWPVSSLEDLASVERGKFTPRPRNDPSYYGGRFPFIQTGDITDSKGRLRSWTQTLNEKGTKVSRSFPPGTIVIAIVGATIGVTAILEIEVFCPDSVVGIQVDSSRATKEYIEFVLRFWRPVFLAQAPEIYMGSCADEAPNARHRQAACARR
jgi:type I restriction enzyme S subunit